MGVVFLSFPTHLLPFQVTASETKKLLVAGKRKEALKVAQQGQLWGPALVLARQLGEKVSSNLEHENFGLIVTPEVHLWIPGLFLDLKTCVS